MASPLGPWTPIEDEMLRQSVAEQGIYQAIYLPRLLLPDTQPVYSSLSTDKLASGRISHSWEEQQGLPKAMGVLVGPVDEQGAVE